MFEHRLGALLGMTIGQVTELPLGELERWQRYWQEENWGPYRENQHAALIVMELRRAHLEKGQKVFMDDFMFKHPADREADAAKLRVAELEIIEHQRRRAERAEKKQAAQLAARAERVKQRAKSKK